MQSVSNIHMEEMEKLNNEFLLFSALGRLDILHQLIEYTKMIYGIEILNFGEAIEIAANANHSDVVEYLLGYNPKNVRFAAYGACRGGNLDLLKRYINELPENYNEDGPFMFRNMYQLAKRNNYADIMRYLTSILR